MIWLFASIGQILGPHGQKISTLLYSINISPSSNGGVLPHQHTRTCIFLKLHISLLSITLKSSSSISWEENEKQDLTQKYSALEGKYEEKRLALLLRSRK